MPDFYHHTFTNDILSFPPMQLLHLKLVVCRLPATQEHLPMKKKVKRVGNVCGNVTQPHRCIICHLVPMERYLPHRGKVTD